VGDTLAVSSANLSGEKSPVRFEEIDPEILEKVDVALDAEVCPLGGETAIARIEGKRHTIVRTGCVSKEEMARVESLLTQMNQE
jgi:tRNA A37 threonylcarbamoyladenosine synthetase subunit TsaC/SUA5/YrdC